MIKDAKRKILIFKNFQNFITKINRHSVNKRKEINFMDLIKTRRVQHLKNNDLNLITSKVEKITTLLLFPNIIKI